MQDTFDIRPYRPGDEAAILASFNRVFAEVCGAGYVDRTIETWRWLYEQNPAGKRIHVAVAPDGTIAAHYAALPNAAVTPVGRTVFNQIVDSFTHPGYRQGLKRPGLFIQTAIPALELWERQLGDGNCFGYPVRAAERMGQRYLNYRVVRVVDYLVRDLTDGRDDGPGDVAVEPLDELGAEVDALAAALADDRQLLIDRNSAYLTWRYRDAPGDPYELHAARRDGALVGLMVLRPEHGLVPDACTIADWLLPGADADVLDALLATATRRGRERGRGRLMAVFPDPAPEHAMLCDRGFSLLPSRDILERRLTYRINQPRLTVEMLADLWYYTLGDSDLV